MMEKLKPCPFCGKPATRHYGNVIGCTDVVNCGALIELGNHGENTFAFTRDSWNRRVKNESLRAEVEALRKCCTQRGARMQIMREWLDSQYGIGPPTEWWYFCEETPGAEHWFDADGVPVEDAALRGEGE